MFFEYLGICYVRIESFFQSSSIHQNTAFDPETIKARIRLSFIY